MSDGALLDLVCGPASPLPETYQRYRLVAHLGSGGQAEVYRAVRLCGGVSSAPMTVKVFRVDPRRPLADELRSWDKGDAALMDLNNRGVTGICRRADGFYGPPPHKTGEPAPAGDAVPYQVYDYLHGINLREYVKQRAGLRQGDKRLNAIGTLRTLAGILRALHLPEEAGATPVLHMDIKPANLMVLTNGEVRLIDFTGARYWRVEEITQVSFTPESGGPEAFGGARSVGPAYDVHGFGAVAYFLATGGYPRVDANGSTPAGPDSMLRRHPLLERAPQLRDHLHAPLADRPGDRPDTADLPGWVEDLGGLMRRSALPDVGVDWSEPDRSETARAVGRAAPRRPLTGTETGAFERIERLERELVELRAFATAVIPSQLSSGPAPTQMAPTRMAPAQSLAPARPVRSHAEALPGGEEPARMRGRAAVPQQQPLPRDEDYVNAAPRPSWEPPTRGRSDPGALQRGGKITVVAGVFAFVCWGIWAISNKGGPSTPLFTLLVVTGVAAGVFTLARLVGRIVLEQRLGRVRHTARGAHALTAVFLFCSGAAYLKQTAWVVELLVLLDGFVNG